MTFSPCTIPAPRGLPDPCTASSSSSHARHDAVAFLGGRISSNSPAHFNHKSSHLHPTFSSLSNSEQEFFPSTSCSYSTVSSVSQCNKGRSLAWSASSQSGGPFQKNSRSPSRIQHSGLKMVLCHSNTKSFQFQQTHFWQCRQNETRPHFLHHFWQSRQIQTRTHFSKPRQIQIRATGVASVTAEEENVARNNSAGTESSSGGKAKASGQLARWARARKIRAGKLSPTQKKNEGISASVDVQEVVDSSSVERAVSPEAGEDEDYEGGRYYGAEPEAYEKGVYMISDGTGWTADHSVHAALGQFEHCMVDRRCSVDTHLFSDVNDVDSLMGIIRHAGLKGGMVVYTMADPTMAEAAKEACELLRVPHIDILGPITEALGKHLGVSPLGLPRGAPGRKHTLSKQYFKRIEAVEFTIKQDDGALPKNLHLADIVLAGVSRTSKTPLSTYIAQKGYKVANVPLVFGIDPPKELFNVDQDKVFGLTINANFLKAIRMARYRHLGVAENSSSSYSDMEHIRRELEYSRKLFSQNPRWPVVEVTGKAIEETAAVILRLYHERRNKFSMPRISTRY